MDIIEKALAFAEEFFKQDFSGHDYFHTLRVFHMATHLAEKEQAEAALEEKMERWVYLNDLAEQIEATKK